MCVRACVRPHACVCVCVSVCLSLCVRACDCKPITAIFYVTTRVGHVLPKCTTPSLNSGANCSTVTDVSGSTIPRIFFFFFIFTQIERERERGGRGDWAHLAHVQTNTWLCR